ncbi:PaaX family transcriptional regulator [Sphaerisporangium krabiense]|uniref:Phenylacetic acid degradation operon negative regulatory protein n=1 Tax=Sphaerisporangium krabiense TaxID=763782 RepID=A0A7W8ZBQ3_9ACTN|nr:PaaX family transcriptional regulator C-terminal domain-containing protein [Sphaerisporangium krabiense]MBB5631052.1 phenylacetic acid degradation operon negative regulatory protein [Sphaerisporangium krabiense]GII65935.1 PaaX family transcriptional regulator [Sphaerisporangium krabiense]
MTKNSKTSKVAETNEASGVPMAGWLEPPQPQDLVVTLLADNVRHRLDSVWSGGLVRLLGEFGFSVGASRVALTRLARRDLISRAKKGRLVAYRLTERTERVIAEGDDRIFRLGREEMSAGRMTVLWHTLPEDSRLERARLARRLRFLGFGSVQDATWISLGDREPEVVNLVKDLDIDRFVSLMTGEPSPDFGLGPLIERAWDLAGLTARYEAFLAEFSPFGAEERRRELTDGEAFRVRTQLVHNFRQFPFLDPGLPSADAARDRSVELFHTVYPALKEQAHRHFDVLATPDEGVR